MAVEEIAPSVWGISLGYVNAFVVASGGPVLVDAGMVRHARTIRRALEGLGFGPLAHVALTHHHADHAGALVELVAESGAQVWAHPADAAVVRGERARPGPNVQGFTDRLMAILTVPTPPPAAVDHEVSDGQELPIGGGIRVIHTPGHTPGHLSFLHHSSKVLFVGDAAGNILGRLGPPLGVYTEDREEAKRSIAKIAAVDFEIACFGHGRVLKGEANLRFRRLVESLAG